MAEQNLLPIYEDDINEQFCNESLFSYDDASIFSASISLNNNDSAISTNNNTNHPESNVILSVIWQSGFLVAAYFDISTMELYVSPETFDPKPNYSFLTNLFHQLNITEVIVSGPTKFIQMCQKLCGIPVDGNLEKYRVALNAITTSTTRLSFSIYTNNEKTLDANRKRIYNLQLPNHLNQNCDKNIKWYLETKIPIHQELVAQSMGNLLHYLDANWCHIFLTNDPTLMIIDYNIISLEKQVIIDECTMLALQIFAPTERHPSGFKRGAEHEVKEGLSLYEMFEKCLSKIGQLEMKMLFLQPTYNEFVLMERYDMIEWCLKKSNINRINSMKSILKDMTNISETFLRLKAQGYNTKVNDWMILYENIMRIHRMYVLSREIVKKQPNDNVENANDENDFLHKLATFNVNDENDIQNSNFFNDDDDDDENGMAVNDAITLLTLIFDVQTSKRNNRFMVKGEFDVILDDLKVNLMDMRHQMESIVHQKIVELPHEISNIQLEFINEYGFILCFMNDNNIEHNQLLARFKEHGFIYLYKLKKKYGFKSLLLIDLNIQYIELRSDIRYKEQIMGEVILLKIEPNIIKFQRYIHLCAKLDCFIAIAQTAKKFNLIRPNITHDKCIAIENGRHILLEKCNDKDIITNNTLINENEKNFITILTAPNSTGKSIYLKQMAITVYLTHIGSFVPATSATIGLVDAFYFHMPITETLMHNSSGFLNELQQLSKIVMDSTNKSLVIIDDFGHGTTIEQGKAFLCSTIQNLMDRHEYVPISIICTHYIDIIDVIEMNEWVCVKTIAFERNADNSIKSTYKIVNGRCLDKYAMECAEVKAAIEYIFADDNSDSDDDPSNSGEKASANNAIEQKKIKLAFDIFQMYVQNGSVNAEEVDKMFDEANN